MRKLVVVVVAVAALLVASSPTFAHHGTVAYQLTAPNKLAREAWTKHSLNPGDQITVTGPVGKNNGRSIWIQKLIGPDGQPMQLFED